MSGLQLLSYKDPTISHCEECGNVALHNSKPRTILEKIFCFIPCFGLYRCHECNLRGWKLELEVDKNFWRNLLIYILFAIVAAIIVAYLMKFFVKS